MRLFLLFTFGLIGVAILVGASKTGETARPVVHKPTYTEDGRLRPPIDYREWIYLSSGLGMSYTPGATDHPMFDNVFANPEAYRSFLQTGTWPDGTMLALERRGSESDSSINKAGHFQSAQMMGLELHVKDSARGGWAFYGFDSDAPAKMIPKQADCYSCHQEHGAVDTTFVQFYPTLMPLAKQKGTLSTDYLKNEPAAGR